MTTLISNLEDEEFPSSYYIISQSDLCQSTIGKTNATKVNNFRSIKALKINYALDSEPMNSKLYEEMIDCLINTNPNSELVKIHLNITCKKNAEIDFGKKANGQILNVLLLISKLKITKLEVSMVPKVFDTIKLDMKQKLYDAFSESCQIDSISLKNLPDNWSYSVSNLRLRGLNIAKRWLKSCFLECKRPPKSKHIRDIIDIEDEYLLR